MRSMRRSRVKCVVSSFCGFQLYDLHRLDDPLKLNQCGYQFISPPCQRLTLIVRPFLALRGAALWKFTVIGVILDQLRFDCLQKNQRTGVIVVTRLIVDVFFVFDVFAIIANEACRTAATIPFCPGYCIAQRLWITRHGHPTERYARRTFSGRKLRGCASKLTKIVEGEFASSAIKSPFDFCGYPTKFFVTVIVDAIGGGWAGVFKQRISDTRSLPLKLVRYLQAIANGIEYVFELLFLVMLGHRSALARRSFFWTRTSRFLAWRLVFTRRGFLRACHVQDRAR